MVNETIRQAAPSGDAAPHTCTTARIFSLPGTTGTRTGSSTEQALGPGWLANTSDLVTSVERAAALLGVSRSTGYEAVRKGDIPSFRLGRRILVPVNQLRVMVGIAESPPPDAPNWTIKNVTSGQSVQR